MGPAESICSKQRSKKWYSYLLVSTTLIGGFLLFIYQTSSTPTWSSSQDTRSRAFPYFSKQLVIINEHNSDGNNYNGKNRQNISSDANYERETNEDKSDSNKNTDQNSSNNEKHTSNEATNCSCSMKPLNFGNDTLQTFKMKIPLLNLTTEDELRHRHPNLPIHLILQMIEKGKCDLMPSHLSIKWTNTYWQEAKLSDNTTFLAYSAFYDNRTETDIRPCVRILGVSMRTKIRPGWCQLWFSSFQPPIVSEVHREEHLDYQSKSEDREMPYLLSCPVPQIVAHLKPEAVSLVPHPCQKATNLLKVIGASERKASAFLNVNNTEKVSGPKPYASAVCGPALYYYHEDFSYRLVEWLEILKAQGISQVFLYETDIHPNIQKVLRHYESVGFVQVIKYSYPPPYINEASIRRLWTVAKRPEMFSQENVYFTDCLLRHMHEYRFIAHYDPDEVPVLLKYKSYTDFLHAVLQKAEKDKSQNHNPLPVGYQLQWNIFYDDIQVPESTRAFPNYLYILRHILRPKEDYPTSPGTYKTLYDMDLVTGVFSHGVLVCAKGHCPSGLAQISPTDAYLAHFTWTCGQKCQNASYLKEESMLLHQKEQIQSSVEAVLNTIKIS